LIHEHVVLGDLLARAGDARGLERVLQLVLQYKSFVRLLERRHRRVDHNFLLRREDALQHVGLDPSQQKGPQNLVELRDDAVLALVVDDVVDLRLLAYISKPEPGLEDGQVVEDLGVHEVQETPELFQRVLDRCTAQ
jgi:hypothetical protein